MEITLPWLVVHDGYTTKITGQLLHLEATTSLQVKYFYSLLKNNLLIFINVLLLIYSFVVIMFKVS